MKRFLRDVVGFCLLVGLLLILLGWVVPSNPNSYFASIRPKMALLERKDGVGPRCLLVGGSAVAFSVDGVQLGQELGRPVVNMGIHANLGLRYMLNSVMPHVRKDDLIVVMPEYQQFFDKLVDGRPRELTQTVYFRPGTIFSLTTLRQRMTFLFGFPALVTGKIDWLRALLAPGTVYSLSAFDPTGNVVGHLGKPGKDQRGNRIFFGDAASLPVDRPALEALASFIVEMEKRGAQVRIAYPAIARTQFDQEPEAISRVQGVLEKEFGGQVMGKPKDNVLLDDLLFDSVYHFGAEGRRQQTDFLALHLKNLR